MVYTTDGPLATSNGISFTATELVFDPSQVTDGLVTKIIAGDNITVSGDGTGEVTITGEKGGGFTPTTGTITSGNTSTMVAIPVANGQSAVQVYIITAQSGQNLYKTYTVTVGYGFSGFGPAGNNVVTAGLSYQNPLAPDGTSFSVTVTTGTNVVNIQGTAGIGSSVGWLAQRIA